MSGNQETGGSRSRVRARPFRGDKAFTWTRALVPASEKVFPELDHGLGWTLRIPSFAAAVAGHQVSRGSGSRREVSASSSHTAGHEGGRPAAHSTASPMAA